MLSGPLWPVNVKRVERLWRLEGLRVPPRRGPNGQKALGGDQNSAWALPALRPIHIWSYDFVTVRTLEGCAVRVLNVVDVFTRIALGSRVARSIGARDVVVHLDHRTVTWSGSTGPCETSSSDQNPAATRRPGILEHHPTIGLNRGGWTGSLPLGLHRRCVVVHYVAGPFRGPS